MKKTMTLKVTSFFVTIFLLISSLYIPAFSVASDDISEAASLTNNDLLSTPEPSGENEIISEQTTAALSDFKLGEGEKTLSELSAMTLDLNTLPEAISIETAAEKGHVNRLKAQEKSLSTVIFQNRDGGKTQYIFSRPVKYINSEGEVRDRSTKIAAYNADGYAYAMTDNSVKAYFPANIANGIKVAGGGYNVIISPASSPLSSAQFSSDENLVAYGNAFGANTILTYKTLNSGVKEDIVLVKYTGQNNFSFTLDAGGLTPYNDNGRWYLKNSDGHVIGSFSDIIVKDSGNKQTTGTLDIIASSDGKYTMTVSVSSDFLTANDTTYPVYVDPTFTIGEEFLGEKGVIDVPLFDDFSVASYFWDDQTTVCLGTPSSYDGVGKIIYKLPDFCKSDIDLFGDLNQYQISTVRMYIHATCTSAATLVVNPMTSTFELDSSGNEPSYILDGNADYYEAYSTVNSRSHYLSAGSSVRMIDITHLAKAWARYNAGETTNAYDNPANGFLLSVSNPNNPVVIRNSEYDTNSVEDVYYTIDYSTMGGEYFIYQSGINNDFLTASGNDVIMDDFSNTASRKWIIEYSYGYYYIRSAANPNYYLRNTGTGVDLALFDLEYTDDYLWTVAGANIYNITASAYLIFNGTSVTIGNTPAVNGTPDQQYLWSEYETKKYVPITSVTISSNYVAMGETKEISINVEPQNATWSSSYEFTSSISGASIQLSNNNISAGILGVSQGTAVLTLVHRKTNTTYSFNIECIPILEGEYYFSNDELNNCMQINDNALVSDDTFMELHEFDGESYQKWRFEYLGNNQYKIVSVASGKVLTAPSSLNESITQASYSSSNTQKWIVNLESNNKYKLSPISNPTHYMAAGSGVITANGRNVELRENQSDGKDEWFVYYVAKHLGSLDFWYDEETDDIGWWENTPSIYREKLNNNQEFFFETSTSTAITQWNNALNISMSYVQEKETADILYYGGTEEELSDYKYESEIGVLGKTHWSCSYVGFFDYDGKIKRAYTMDFATCFLLDSGLSENQYKKTATHELGHALGFAGHVVSHTAIMKQGVMNNYTITDYDRKHLQQVYR